MGSGHTHRNKRGRGRKNASGQSRPNGGAGQGTPGAASGRESRASMPEFLPHASQLSSPEPVAQPPVEEEGEAVELISVEEQEAFVVFSSSPEDEIDEMVEAEDEGLVIEDSGPIDEQAGRGWARTGEVEADTGATSGIETTAPQAPAEPPARGRAPRLPGIPFARPDSAARREWHAHQAGETHERSTPDEHGGQNGYHANNAVPNGHHAAHGFNGHRVPPRGRPRDEGEMSSRGNGHAAGNGERAERWPGAERWASAERDELIPRADVRGDVGPLIDELRAVFQRDRAVASGMAASRCGICYLHFPLGELEYRDAEGFYVCPVCAPALGAHWLPMVRRQKRA
jgi:hypothetical protein